MKPISYPGLPSSVAGGHSNFVLDHVLGTSNAMYCDKCGFSTTDTAEFKKHTIEHLGTRYHCFYCYKVSFSEAELCAHLKEHTKYPFKCPHCGHGYMRRLCLVKHIERLHGKNIGQGLTKPAMTKSQHLPISCALQDVPTSGPSIRQPFVRVTVPTPSIPAVRLSKDHQNSKTLKTNLQTVANHNGELLPPPNGLQHNRALTVSLPEEVTIPAGCLVELVEVKTVNGTKELKLRLVSQQENASVVKDTRMTDSQNAALGKTLSPKFNLQNTVKSANFGMCNINRKQCETKAVIGECTDSGAIHFSKSQSNQTSKEKCGLKRKPQEVINLECQTSNPSKVFKSILNPGRGNNCVISAPQREPINDKTASSQAVISPRISNRLTSSKQPENTRAHVPSKPLCERKTFVLEQPKSLPMKTGSDVKSTPLDMSLPVKMEPGEMRLKDTSPTINKANSSVKQEHLKCSPSLNVNLTAAFKANATSQQTLIEVTSIKTNFCPNRANSGIPTWNQEGKATERAASAEILHPGGFPVISSVFSLSQQTEDAQGSIQPLVLALRGIVMPKDSSSERFIQEDVKETKDTEQGKEMPKPMHGTQEVSHKGSFAPPCLLTERTSECVKTEDIDKRIQESPSLTLDEISVKEEEKGTNSTHKSNCTDTSVFKSSDDTHADKARSFSSLQQTLEPDLSSKFLTVSLERVDESVWRKNKNGLELKMSKYKTETPLGPPSDSAIIHPMPLKVDQLVKQPGPNQPVVVLNHPKPRASMQKITGTVAVKGTPEMVPKCHIIKMRLSKVMGQKYEMMGCTVRVCP